ncbi:DUF6758 family protein [Nocardioides sp.]|uniref:DUF6758 family protein n=1 Tax=Nocardioides sp. TaxID=35761 RepID=UPI0035286A97
MTAGGDERGLLVGCPRCAEPVGLEAGGVRADCSVHGPVPALWRAAQPAYDAFGALLVAADGFPTYLPWPLAPGWRVSDFAYVAGPAGARATMTCCSGSSELDGPVDLVVVTEEPATGLGARVAGVAGDPGPDLGRGRPAAHVRLDGQSVALWPLSTSAADADFDRSVVVGEAHGRWLWLVLRPASAMLLLGDDQSFRDVAAAGPALVELEFGGPAPVW